MPTISPHIDIEDGLLTQVFSDGCVIPGTDDHGNLVQAPNDVAVMATGSMSHPTQTSSEIRVISRPKSGFINLKNIYVPPGLCKHVFVLYSPSNVNSNYRGLIQEHYAYVIGTNKKFNITPKSYITYNYEYFPDKEPYYNPNTGNIELLGDYLISFSYYYTDPDDGLVKKGEYNTSPGKSMLYYTYHFINQDNEWDEEAYLILDEIPNETISSTCIIPKQDNVLISDEAIDFYTESYFGRGSRILPNPGEGTGTLYLSWGTFKKNECLSYLHNQ